MNRSSAANPTRSSPFRLITIAAAGLGSLVLAGWAIRNGYGPVDVKPQAVGIVVAALSALAAAGTALSFYAGVDESVSYVHQETQVDKLTGMHSRQATMTRIAAAAAGTVRDGKPVFLIDIDIDRFKQINDAIGYSQGDELIRAFARRLVEHLPKGTELGRIGAGEFVALIPDRPDLAIDQVIEGLVDEMTAPFALRSLHQSVNISVGLVAMPKDGHDPVVLLRRSNLALQNARAGGIGNWSVFHPEMGQIADYRQWIEAELHAAYKRGDFELHYQPQVDLAAGRVVGYEALLRWRHPQRGVIPPGEFVPVAEQTGMISLIGEWVLRQACRDALDLPDGTFVAVNISPVQLMSRDLVQQVRDALAATGLPAERLELEVTETAMMQDRERAAAQMRDLVGMGISVAVDDFGTGYSNLGYLIDFPFRKLKIDRSFVTRIDRDNGGAVVATIVGLSRALGVRTIAEGVETETQAQLLRAAGCDVVQGFLYGRPLPLAGLGRANVAAA